MFERLTMHTPDNFGYAEYQLKQYVDEQDVISRLAAYEDTGLTPKQIQEQQRYIKALEKQVEVEGQQAIIEALQQENEQLKADCNRLKALIEYLRKFKPKKNEAVREGSV